MAGISFSISGQIVEADFAAVYKSRAALAAASFAVGDIAFLAEPGREGTFIYDGANLSAAVSSDSLQGLYVAPAVSPTGAAGAWARIWDKINGHPEWFYLNDWADAIEECFKLCPVTQLGRKDYYHTRTIRLNVPWRTVRGQGGVAYNGVQGTRLVFGSGSGDAMHIGPEANPGGNPGLTFLRGVRLQDFQLTRGLQVIPTETIATSPTGLRAQFLFDCDIDIYSWESSIGCQIKGCVLTRVKCTYERSGNASTSINDVAIGTYVDATSNIGLAGGNASITVRALSSIPNTTAPTRIGVYAYGRLADTTFDHCETVGGLTAMLLKATGTAANNVDIRLITPTLDQPTNRGLALEDFPTGSQIDIVSPYVGVPSAALAAIDLQNCFADIAVIGGQLIGSSGGLTYGVRALNSRSLNLYSTGILDFPNPVFLDGSTDCSIQPNISNPNTSGVAYAIGLSGNCARCTINAKINGKAFAFPAAAVMLFTDSITDVRIQTERIDIASASGGRKLMIGSTNIPITTSGRYFGTGSADAAGTVVAEGMPVGDLLVPSGKVIEIGGTQVLAARQTGTPAASSDLDSVIRLANFLRTALLNHGAIS